MIRVMLMFGPCHGRQFTATEANKEIVAIEDADVIFQDVTAMYRNGPPMAEDIISKRHHYVLFELFDQGLDEVALYMHSEDCWDKGIPIKKEEQEKRQMPKVRKDPWVW